MISKQPKRSHSNIIMASIYYMWAIFFPIVLIMIYLDTVAHGQLWYMVTAGLSLLFLCISGIVLVSESFPRENKKIVLLFVSFIINAIISWLSSKDYTSEHALDVLFISSVITCVGVVFGILLSVVVDSWYDEEAVEKGNYVFLDSFKKKIMYIKKHPTIIAGLVILCIPIVFAIHVSLIGLRVHVSMSLFSQSFATVVYICMIANVSFVNYKTCKPLNVVVGK